MPYHTRAAALAQLFSALGALLPGHHFTDFRLLGCTIALMWGRRKVAKLYGYLDAEQHRPRFHNVF